MSFPAQLRRNCCPLLKCHVLDYYPTVRWVIHRKGQSLVSLLARGYIYTCISFLPSVLPTSGGYVVLGGPTNVILYSSCTLRDRTFLFLTLIHARTAAWSCLIPCVYTSLSTALVSRVLSIPATDGLVHPLVWERLLPCFLTGLELPTEKWLVSHTQWRLIAPPCGTRHFWCMREP